MELVFPLSLEFGVPQVMLLVLFAVITSAYPGMGFSYTIRHSQHTPSTMKLQSQAMK